MNHMWQKCGSFGGRFEPAPMTSIPDARSNKVVNFDRLDENLDCLAIVTVRIDVRPDLVA